jgi:DNA invertase Pin-like site-specific DNA recombinase
MVRRKKVAGRDVRRAVGYVRVSTQEQRLGPKAQAAALDRWAAREGVQLIAVFVDHGVSGATPLSDRPGLIAALAALEQADAGVLVAAKRDRLAREVGIARAVEAQAAKEGAIVRTADGTSDATGSAGVISKGLHDLLGEWEREVIRERTRAALALKRARGERVGKVPFGSRLAADGVHLEPEPSEQAALASMRALRAAGASLRDIVARLDADGATCRGRKWHLTTVARLLQRDETPAE